MDYNGGMAAAPSNSRRYHHSDIIKLKRRGLLALVERQRDKWPQGITLNSKTTKATFCEVLLDARYGFTTDNLANEASLQAANERSAHAHAYRAPSVNNPSLPVAGSIPLPAPPSEPLPCLGGSYQRTLHLYIEDHRIGSRSSVSIAATVADRIGCAPGEWRVEASHILEKLQQSTAEIRGPGPVKIGTADLVHPTYTMYFLESSVKDLTRTPANPTHLVVPASERASLTLRVEYLGGVNGLKLACKDIPSDDERDISFPPGFRPLAAGRERVRTGSQALPRSLIWHGPDSEDLSTSSQSSHARAHQGRVERDRKVLHHLENLVKLRPGYASYIQSRHAVMQNPDILPIWRFATSFMNEYVHAISPISSDPPGKRITQKSILDALGVGETWYRDAADGIRLVDLYRAEGPLAAPDVIQELEIHRDIPRGKGKLLRFLREWETDHHNDNKT
ncbi:hypothetical protein FPV67DRAFT_1745765 [Lyophyllum atratum]|nr:hypothetical protein FPV67DRAFT_1745762 [Lyophyllum atratum]KAF8071482.1 hypothetical protein FPV67DRAFT_1745765 [Lyophyllum atratum]